jgi:ABC-type dipeptide/oligopeptide/nickel transport system permease subunit
MPAWPRGAELGLAAAALAAAALLAPVLVGGDPLAQDLAARNRPPDAAHWLGFDHLGRDVLVRLAHGAGLSLGVAGAATALALLLGGLGLLAITLGQWAEAALYGAFDLVRAMPSILLALTLLTALGPGLSSVALALGIAYAPQVAEVARAACRRELASDYVAAAIVAGATPLSTLRVHLLPNLAGVLVTQAALILPRAVTTESVLSFFGVGATPETATWGRMIADATRFAEGAPHALLAPVAALALATLTLAVMGDRLRVALDPLRR